MPRRREIDPDDFPTRTRPATTPDARETQMIELADQLAEKQLREGTASAQVITHFLKAGSSRERLEQEKIALEHEFLRAKTEALAAQERQMELMENAIRAMGIYSGREPTELPSQPEEYFE